MSDTYNAHSHLIYLIIECIGYIINLNYTVRVDHVFTTYFPSRIWWNYLSIFLSLAINVLMLVTWEAPMSLADVPENVTQMPSELHE